jgi:NADH-quinone oxidoreductase subunit F
MSAPSPSQAAAAPEVLARLEASGLRGRGGGWFPAARKWRAVLAERGQAVVVGNGAEGEPGSIKDRFLLRTRPAEVMAGLELAASALGAEERILYLKGAFEREESRLREVSGRATVRRGADTYVAGEETAVLEALEHRRAWPRPKPPLPAAVGLRGRPTLVQNVETLWRLPAAVRDPDAFRARETTLVSLWGHVHRPGVYDVPLGTPLRRVLDDWGGGPTDGIGLIFPAGPSAPPLLPEQSEVPLDPDALREAGSGLGTAAVLVAGRGACPLALAASAAAFFEREACGQCPPCTVGTASLSRIVRGLEAGDARARDLASLDEVAGFMSVHGYCAHSRTAAAAVRGVLGRMPSEVEAHLRAGRCPRAGVAPDPFATDSPERLAIEQALDRQT